jgi:hypothetical protein
MSKDNLGLLDLGQQVIAAGKEADIGARPSRSNLLGLRFSYLIRVAIRSSWLPRVRAERTRDEDGGSSALLLVLHPCLPPMLFVGRANADSPIL